MGLTKKNIFVISTSIWLSVISAISLLNIFHGNLQTYVLLLTTIIYASFIYLVKPEGSIPQQLLRDYTPLPLALINPPNRKLQSRIQKYILPAAQTSLDLTKVNVPEKAYHVIKSMREFFNKEMDAVNIDKIVSKIKHANIYSHIEDNEERSNWEYSLASLIHWIYRYRNLACHSPEVKACPIDAWLALRTALIYIKDRYKMREAILYTRCPHCNAVNDVTIEEKNTRWLQKLRIICSKCKREYEIELTPQTIIDHYTIRENIAQNDKSDTDHKTL